MLVELNNLPSRLDRIQLIMCRIHDKDAVLILAVRAASSLICHAPVCVLWALGVSNRRRLVRAGVDERLDLRINIHKFDAVPFLLLLVV